MQRMLSTQTNMLFCATCLQEFEKPLKSAVVAAWRDEDSDRQKRAANELERRRSVVSTGSRERVEIESIGSEGSDIGMAIRCVVVGCLVDLVYI